MSYVFLLGAVTTFALTVTLMPLVVHFASKKADQPILEYVDQHKGKSGTPTMGGIGFIIPAVAVTLILSRNGLSSGRVAALTTLAYAILGFLDDFLKVKRKDNGGLLPWQKIVGQTLVAAIMGWYCYRVGLTTLRFPFTSVTVDVGLWIIPIVSFVFIAMSNGVNLTDGLDCLATSTVAVYSLVFSVILIALNAYGKADFDLALFSTCILFALIGFAIFNSSPAKIFMGDTGSLALGGAAAAMGVFSENIIISGILGITFVLSCISVIIQVGVFKLRKRRVFLMAPFHHHLEKKGWSEPRIVALYVAMTAICGIACVTGTLGFQI
ncbi:MAG: phospho-N-acetylmuramoyl-pentapeptide-transferase [Clostridia bacterium]|nr:phospho-N-acetylmuramoyl-pentapeptide-transferase [Clostridia bacterium]